MTLDDLERKIGVLWIFLAILGCETHFNERIAPKSIEIDTE